MLKESLITFMVIFLLVTGILGGIAGLIFLFVQLFMWAETLPICFGVAAMILGVAVIVSLLLTVAGLLDRWGD